MKLNISITNTKHTYTNSRLSSLISPHITYIIFCFDMMIHSSIISFILNRSSLILFLLWQILNQLRHTGPRENNLFHSLFTTVCEYEFGDIAVTAWTRTKQINFQIDYGNPDLLILLLEILGSNQWMMITFWQSTDLYIYYVGSRQWLLTVDDHGVGLYQLNGNSRSGKAWL